MAIKSIEWLGMYEAAELLVRSEWMRDEVIRQYKVPPAKIRIVPPNSPNWPNDILKAYTKVVEMNKIQ